MERLGRLTPHNSSTVAELSRWLTARPHGGGVHPEEVGSSADQGHLGVTPQQGTRPHRGRHGQRQAQISFVDLKLSHHRLRGDRNRAHRTHQDAPVGDRRTLRQTRRIVETGGQGPVAGPQTNPSSQRAVEANPMMPPITVNPTMASRTLRRMVVSAPPVASVRAGYPS